MPSLTQLDRLPLARGCTLAALGILLHATPARAYRTLADDPANELSSPAVWSDATIDWDLYAPDLLSADLVRAEGLAIEAFDAWSATDCTQFRGNYRGATTNPPAPRDGRNSIAVITTGWTSIWGLPAGKGATTDVRFLRGSDGSATIVEADIYLNFEQHDFILDRGDATRLDFGGVVTHELGHLAGALHPCDMGDDPTAPACEVDPGFMGSALFPTYLGPSQRVLGADDVDMICTLYPGGACSPACPGGMECRRGMCVTACTGAECMPAGCDAGGCAPTNCTSDASCEVGVCGVWGMVTSTCVPAGSTGAPCADGEACASGLCLTSDRAARPFCTVPCSSGAECGTGDCISVDGARVCVPPRPRATCAAFSPTRRTSPGSLALLMFLPWFAVRWRAHRRTRRSFVLDFGGRR